VILASLLQRVCLAVGVSSSLGIAFSVTCVSVVAVGVSSSGRVHQHGLTLSVACISVAGPRGCVLQQSLLNRSLLQWACLAALAVRYVSAVVGVAKEYQPKFDWLDNFF